MQEVLVVENISKSFEKDRKNTLILQNICIRVKKGEFVCIVGKSGCGKTTLLNIVAGFDSPDSGKVFSNGKIVSAPGKDRGFVFQEESLYPWLKVRENIAFGLKANGDGKRKREKKTEKYSKSFQLEPLLNLFPHQLSAGMKKRVSIVRALAVEPDILLMDEPFANLDVSTKEKMLDELLAIWKKTGLTIVFVTHDVGEAVYLATRIIVLGGEPAKIKRDIELEYRYPRNRKSASLKKREVELIKAIRGE